MNELCTFIAENFWSVLTITGMLIFRTYRPFGFLLLGLLLTVDISAPIIASLMLLAPTILDFMIFTENRRIEKAKIINNKPAKSNTRTDPDYE